MDIQDLLYELDGNGLVITDWQLIDDAIWKLGYALFDKIEEPHKEDEKDV